MPFAVRACTSARSTVTGRTPRRCWASTLRRIASRMAGSCALCARTRRSAALLAAAASSALILSALSRSRTASAANSSNVDGGRGSGRGGDGGARIQAAERASADRLRSRALDSWRLAPPEIQDLLSHDRLKAMSASCHRCCQVPSVIPGGIECGLEIHERPVGPDRDPSVVVL